MLVKWGPDISRHHELDQLGHKCLITSLQGAIGGHTDIWYKVESPFYIPAMLFQ